MKELLIDNKTILKYTSELFFKIGCPSTDSEIIAKALVDTSLWGIDSHGIARITHYLERLENGTINKTPKLNFTKTAAATGQLDGDDGHGIVIMTTAAKHAIELAKDAGVGVVGVKNSSHCGALGLFTRQIAQSGMAGMAFTHADSLVVPFGGNQPFFGTNPLSISFPSENNDEPICLDMSTSIVPWNYIMNAKRENEKVPFGLGVDKNGYDSEIANDIIAVKPMAQHKGYALAFLIDMLCGPLNGMNSGANMISMYNDMDKKRKLGSLVIAIDPAKFGGRDTLRIVATSIINQVKTHGENVLFPGEPEYINKKKRLQNGIPVSETMLADFKKWSDKLGVKVLV